MKRLISLVAAASALVLGLTALTACGGDAGASDKVELALVAYSTPQAAYEEIIKAFQKTPTGKNVTFTQVYGASGDQSRAVESGLPADIVGVLPRAGHDRGSSTPDIVAEDWNADEYKGMVTDRSWCSSSARATRRTSRPGTT